MSKGVRTVRTPHARECFLQALTTTANVTAACELAGIGRVTAYEWRVADESFANAWKSALEIGIEALEDAAMRRAKDGLLRYVTSAGKVVMHPETGEPLTETVYSDALTMFLLRAYRPEKYRETGSSATAAIINVNISSDDAAL